MRRIRVRCFSFTLFVLLPLIFLVTALEAPAATAASTRPPAPGQLSAYLMYPRVYLSWGISPPVTVGYNVYRSTSAKRGFGKINSSLVTVCDYYDSPPAVDTTYYYKVTGVNAAGTEGPASSVVSILFYDNAPPVISGIAVDTSVPGKALVTWTTDEPATSQVEYGATATYGQTTPPDPVLVTSHAVWLENLSSGSLYHYRVRSTDAKDNAAVSADGTFTSLDIIPPAISAVSYLNTIRSTSIRWTTDEASTSQVEYGTTTAYGTLTNLDPSMVTSHNTTITGLESTTLYHFRVRSKDAAGNEAVSGDYTFTTRDWVPPGPVTSLTATPYEGWVSLSWRNPIDADTAGTRLRYSTSGYPNSAYAGTLLANQTGGPGKLCYFSHGGLAGGRTYYYAAFAYDGVPNFSTAAQIAATTAPNVPPVISAVSAYAFSRTSSITWITNEPASSQVEYGLTTAYGQLTTYYPMLDTMHFVDLFNLTPGTLYHYRVRSLDGAGNEAISADYTFTTQGTKPLGPVTSFSAVPGNGRITLNWTNPVSTNLLGVHIMYKTTGYPAGPTDGTLVTNQLGASGANCTFNHTGLVNGLTYYYAAYAFDNNLNYGPGTQTSGVPQAPPPPVISQVKTGGIGADYAIMKWKTDILADSGVMYGFSPSLLSVSVSQSMFTTNHLVSLGSLTSDRVFYYKVLSTGQGGSAAYYMTIHSFRTVGTAEAACLSCHDGSDPAAPYAGDFTLEGHGKGDVNQACADCHIDHQATPEGYKYLKAVNGHSYPSPYGTGPWQDAMRAQRDYCELACHMAPLIGAHPVADDPTYTAPVPPYVWFSNTNITFLPGPDLPLFDSDRNGVQSTWDIVMCNTCHDSHGRAGHATLLRDGPAEKGGPVIGLCNRCHPY